MVRKRNQISPTEEDEQTAALLMEINKLCDDKDWYVVMSAIVHLFEAGLALAPENVNAREMFESLVRQIRKRVWG